MNLVSIDYRTLIKRLQDSYQEITGLLSRDYKTPMNKLSTDYRTLIKRVQDSYQEITGLL